MFLQEWKSTVPVTAFVPFFSESVATHCKFFEFKYRFESENTVIDSYQQFFILFFSLITQHSIQNITKLNNRHILNISKSSQKGGREGRTTRTQKSLLYTITYVQQKTLPSINGRRPGPTDSCRYRRLRIQYVFLHMCGVNQFCIIVFFAAVKPANIIFFALN